jgi:hypothetical protein
MSNSVSIDNLSSLGLGPDRLQPVAPPGSVEPVRVLKDRDANRFPDSHLRPEGTAPKQAEELRRSLKPEVRPDLNTQCPICGCPYQPGERVLALACLSFAEGPGPSSPPAAACDASSKTVLGHRQCVLPRLLTLLASFGPAARFVTALKGLPAAESAFLEGNHAEP